jgi:serine/threonine protein kinase
MHRNSAPISEIFQFICDVCAGLIELGELKIVHLDLKLSNFIKTKKAIKIIDFDHAISLGLTNNFINHKNYLNES